MPWLVGMTYKAVRTERYKFVHWVHHDGCDELYDLAEDPYELRNVIAEASYQDVHAALRLELARLVAESVGL
jgi:N-acetylglucosamine-6-sulfatase